MRALGFGPFILKWIHTLYRLDQPLSRMVLVNGGFSLPFYIRRGIPQGDSVSSIMQVVIFEGVSRLIRVNSHIGITIPTHREGGGLMPPYHTYNMQMTPQACAAH